jgi:hypothetical protein
MGAVGINHVSILGRVCKYGVSLRQQQRTPVPLYPNVYPGSVISWKPGHLLRY